ncbi:MAG: hypothetical protein FGM41_01845, partial [Bacteroidetes bacterium]|nr:hypothetical protein [Bacteroidota bacterium]
MKHLKLSIFLSTLCILINVHTLFASHVVGVEMRSRNVATRVYEVTLKLYRDCAGVQLCGNCGSGNSPVPCSQSLTVAGITHPAGVAHNLPTQACSGTSFGTYSIPIATGSTVFDAVQLCNLNVSICRNCNTRTPGTFSPGMEVYTFRGNVDLTGLPASCCWVSIGITPICCRNNAVTTLQNPGGITFYGDIQLNICTPTPNESPIFQNEAEPIAVSGVDFSYNIAAYDPDGDSLSFRFGATQTARGTNAPYSVPYSATVPFPYLGAPGQSPPLLPPLGISIDPITGLVRFRTQGSFVSNLVIEVLEWRKINNVTTLLSISKRDIQFYSLTGSSGGSGPSIKIYQDGTVITNLNITTCGSDGICFDVIANASNVTGNDTTDLIITAGSSNATTTVTRPYNVSTRQINGPKHDTLRVCLNGLNNNTNFQAKPYFLHVKAKSRSCPLNTSTTRTLVINKSNSSILGIYKETKVFGVPLMTFLVHSQFPFYRDSTQWYIETTPTSNTFNLVGAGSDTLNNLVLNQGGWFGLRVSVYKPNCGRYTLIDSIFAGDLKVELVNKTNAKCPGDSNGTIVFKRIGSNVPLLATISLGDGHNYFPNLRPWLPVDTISNLPIGLYSLKVKDALGNIDSMWVEIKRSSNPFVLGAASINNVGCNGDTSGMVTLNITGGDSATFRWYSKDSLSWQNSSTFNNLKAGTIKFHVRDSVGCRTNQTLNITQPTVLVSSASVSQLLKCKGDSNATIMVQASGGTSPYQTKLGQGNFASVFNYGNLKAGLYNIEVKDNKGCIKQHSVNIVEPSTKFTASTIVTQPLCNLQSGSATISAQGGVSPYQYWLSGNTAGSNNNIINIPSGNRTLFARDSAQC